jgi:hypothetical protein
MRQAPLCENPIVLEWAGRAHEVKLACSAHSKQKLLPLASSSTDTAGILIKTLYHLGDDSRGIYRYSLPLIVGAGTS